MKNRPLFFITVACFVNCLFAIEFLFAQEPLDLEKPELPLPPIIVTSLRLPEGWALRSASYLTSDEFDETIDNSIPGLAAELPSLDVRERGVFGVQADINIRGATFEQSAVLVNGVRVNDPQTGHHNMDIPFTTMDVENLELLRGGASALYGPDAFGGALNIVIKKPDKRKVRAEFSVGQHDYTQEAVSISQPVGLLRNRISFEEKKSSGYRKATDFEITTFSFDSLLENEFGEIEVIGGWSYKDFGASTFYSTSYPNEGEYTDTKLGIVRAKFSKDMITVEPKIYYRRHWDRFILDRDRRFWCRNTHKSYVAGTDIRATVDTSFGVVLFGTELSWDKIVSTNINKHKRRRQGIFTGYSYKLPSGPGINANFRADHFSDFGWEISPSVSAGYELNDKIQLRSSINRFYSTPSFTDLYYVTPANIGNENLIPESAWSLEGSIDYKDSFLKISATAFNRWARNVIDWARNSTADPWRAENRGEISTFGIETLLETHPKEFLRDSFIDKISLWYDFINSEKNDNGKTLSKYAFNYLKHHFHAKAESSLPFDIKGTVEFSYKERVNAQPYFLLDFKIYKNIEMAGFKNQFYIEGTNLLNTSYSEVGGVPMPGIWIIGGIKAQF